ncbi:hypothetical protein YC2023_041325 [Brassica napus]
MDPRRNGSETACGLHPKPSLSAKHDCTALIDVKLTRINVDDVLELIQTKENITNTLIGGVMREELGERKRIDTVIRVREDE